MSMSVDLGLNTFNFIRKHFLQICVRKVVVRLSEVLEVMSLSVDLGLNPFNFIRKQFLQICVRKVAVHLQTGSFFMIRRFQFLHRCYFLWEELKFFSDPFMRCCKPDIFLLRQLAQ
jgi:hypothetical protein